MNNIDFSEYKPHPFPNPLGGNIVEVEDDASVTVKYFLVMGGVLILLMLMSLTAIAVFVGVLKWRWSRRRSAPAAPTPHPNTNQNSTTEVPDRENQ